MVEIARANLPAPITPEYFDGFVARNRPALLRLMAGALEKARAAKASSDLSAPFLVEYGYASSPRAVKLGFADTGAYFVTAYVGPAKPRRLVSKGYATRADADAALRDLQAGGTTEPLATVAALRRRLVPGTRLFLVRSLLGPQPPAGRVVERWRSRDVELRVDDPTSSKHGQSSWLTFSAGVIIEPRENGFAVLEEPGRVAAEYRFADAGDTAVPRPAAAAPPPNVIEFDTRTGLRASASAKRFLGKWRAPRPLRVPLNQGGEVVGHVAFTYDISAPGQPTARALVVAQDGAVLAEQAFQASSLQAAADAAEAHAHHRAQVVAAEQSQGPAPRAAAPPAASDPMPPARSADPHAARAALGAAALGAPVVDSVAAARRLPVGTRLLRVRAPGSPVLHVIEEVTSNNAVLRNTTKRGRDALWNLMLDDDHTTVEPRENGFAVILRRDGSVLAELRFADTAAAGDLPDLSTPPESWSPRERTRVNLVAMHIVANKAPAEITDAERSALLGYSGWGGLSIRDVQGLAPEGMTPEQRGLIHEYYTPRILTDEVARVVAPLVGTLPRLDASAAPAGPPAQPRPDADVLALEPSAGIGRFLHSFHTPAFASLKWRAVEYSELSGRMLRAMRPDVDVAITSFEAWIADNAQHVGGRLGLVVSNPPYGKRGAALTRDPDKRYRERRAYAYFLRRGLDLLAKGGLGVYLIPTGFLTGAGDEARKLRETVLRRHHLSAAFRLPSNLFAAAELVTDLLFFRARGGTLGEVATEDVPILEGRYFELFPAHILGTVHDEHSAAAIGKKARFGYQILGDFSRLPDLVERPLCAACATVVPDEAPADAPQAPVQPRAGLARRTTSAVAAAASEPAQRAIALGQRVDAYLAAITEPTDATAGLWRELHEGLVTWSRVHGNPRTHVELAKLARADEVGAARFLAAFDAAGDVIEGLKRPPTYAPRYRGTASDVAAQAEQLYRTAPDVTPAEVLAFHRSVGVTSGAVR